jgi:hypothetical protein
MMTHKLTKKQYQAIHTGLFVLSYRLSSSSSSMTRDSFMARS